MMLLVVLAISFILLVSVFLISFNNSYKTPVVLLCFTMFFVSAVSCVILNYSECTNGNTVACEAFSSSVIN